MRIKIIAVGKRHDAAIVLAIEDYQKRLQSVNKVEWNIIPSAQRDNAAEQQKTESSNILRSITESDYVVLLDESGTLLNNHQLADVIRQNAQLTLCFVIGGAYGVDERLKQRADLVWSLSPLVFPHQLVRLILVEQIYRSFSIIQNHPYHHN